MPVYSVEFGLVKGSDADSQGCCPDKKIRGAYEVAASNPEAARKKVQEAIGSGMEIYNVKKL